LAIPQRIERIKQLLFIMVCETNNKKAMTNL